MQKESKENMVKTACKQFLQMDTIKYVIRTISFSSLFFLLNFLHFSFLLSLFQISKYIFFLFFSGLI